MSEAEKLAEAIRCAVSAHKEATVFEAISACEVVKLELFEMLPHSMAGVRKSAGLSELLLASPPAPASPQGPAYD